MTLDRFFSVRRSEPFELMTLSILLRLAMIRSLFLLWLRGRRVVPMLCLCFQVLVGGLEFPGIFEPNLHPLPINDLQVLLAQVLRLVTGHDI